MTRTLKIHFLGMMGLIPLRADPAQAQGGGGADGAGSGGATALAGAIIVLPDVRQGIRHHQLPPPGFVAPHLACVMIERRHAPSSSAAVSTIIQPAATGGPFNGHDFEVFPFRHHKLTVKGTDPAQVFDGELGSIPDMSGPVLPGNGEAEQLQWVPMAAEDAQSGPLPFDMRLLDADRVPRHEQGAAVQVLGSFVMTSGRLYVDQVARQGAAPIVYDFMVGSDTRWQQALYDRLVWEAELESDGFTLEFRDAQGGGYDVSVNAQQEEIRIAVASLDFGGVFTDLAMDESAIDVDFGLGYLLSAQPPKNGFPAPIASPPSAAVQPQSVGSRRCRIARYQSEPT